MVCQNASCRPAHCGDGTQDGDESDKDCGGSCQKCGLADSVSPVILMRQRQLLLALLHSVVTIRGKPGEVCTRAM